MTVGQLLDQIRAEKGPFFVARVGLRLSFSPVKEANSTSRQFIQEIVSACRELGYDPVPTLAEL